MKIETINDSNFLNHNFKAPWLNEISYEEWCKFLNHNKNYGREEAYKIIKDFVAPLPKQTLLEIGFGQCYDWQKCFQLMCAFEQIKYTGWEITNQFIFYAKKKYPNYEFCFKTGSFRDLNPITSRHQQKKFDITYTRHTLEHQHPDNCYKYFENILQSTKKLSIIIWFKIPNIEKFTWNDRDGRGQGAYVNTYSKEKLLNIIYKNNFKLNIIDIKYKKNINQLWEMRKL